MRLRLLNIMILAGTLQAQYSPSVSGSNTAAGEINSRPASQSSAGAASGNCTTGKDVWINTWTGAFQGCTATNTWGAATVIAGGALGTPSSGTATNLTGLPLNTGVTGVLPEARGGTGAANNPGAAGHVLRSNGTHYVDSAILAGDLSAIYNHHGYTGTSAIDFSTYNDVVVTASGGNPTVTVTANPALAGAVVNIALCNDTTARAWTLPAAFKRITAPFIASTCIYTTGVVWDGTNYQGGGTDEPASIARFSSERADPGTGNCPSGGCVFPNSTAHNVWFRNSADTLFKMFQSGGDANPDTGQVTATHLSSALPVNQGGTGIDSSGFTGVAKVSSGTWSASAVGSADIAANININTNSSIGTSTGSGLYITGSALTAGNLYYQASGGLTAAKADAATSVPGVCLAISATACMYHGVYRFGSSQSWTAGQVVYVSDSSAGALVTTVPTTSGHYVQRVGVALAADTILLMPSLDVGGIQ